MGGGGGGGGKRGSGGAAVGPATAIQAGSRKIVQSLKEIVNCSEAEIYAMLKECNMDPSEAVHRLLTQDTFHEVKSKREKRREIKDPPELRARSVSSNQSHGARSGTEREGRTNFRQSTLNGAYHGAPHAKPVHKKENGKNTTPFSYSSGTAGSNINQKSTTFSEVVSVQNTSQATAIADGPPLPSQAASGFQHNSWSRMAGQWSMADIVRMGRSQENLPSTPPMASDAVQTSHDLDMSNISHQSITCSPKTATPLESAQALPTSQCPLSKDEEISHNLGTVAGHYNSNNGWSLVGETSAGSGSTHAGISGASIYIDQSASPSLLADEANLEQDPCLDESQVQEVDVSEDSIETDSGSASISDGQIEVDNSVDSTQPDEGQLNGIAVHSQMHAFEHHEVEDVNEEISSATANLQNLNLQKGEFTVPSVDGNPAVIIPSHLQVSNADFSHLSFGSFGSGVNATPSRSFPPSPLGTNLEMAAIAEDTQPDQLNSRNPEYYDGEQLKSNLNENVTSLTSTSTRGFNMPPASLPDNVRHDTSNAAHGIQENFPTVSSYEFPAPTQPTATYTYPDANTQVQNISPFSSLMQSYTNTLPSSLPSSLLAPGVQPLREFDLPLSALLTTQSMPTKYNTSTPSISGPISLPEVKPDAFSASQPMPQALASSNMHSAGGPALPQHLPIHPYSQPTLPLGHFANIIGYPFLPQSYTFLPSAAFQQAYAGNSPFHQSPAGAMKYSLLPQYKSSISGSSLPQAPALPPGYGGFTSSTNNIPGSFSLNPSTATVSTSMGFDGALNSQYKEGSHYMQFQHNENPAMWVHGAAGSRTVSALPGNTSYSFQGQQSQQNGGFRQVQQQQQQQLQLPSQYGQMGYLNLYQTQGGPAQEQHQQNPSEANLSGSSQGPASHSIWQHGR